MFRTLCVKCREDRVRRRCPFFQQTPTEHPSHSSQAGRWTMGTAVKTDVLLVFMKLKRRKTQVHNYLIIIVATATKENFWVL